MFDTLLDVSVATTVYASSVARPDSTDASKSTSFFISSKLPDTDSIPVLDEGS